MRRHLSLVLLLLAGSAQAAPPDLVNCLYANGVKIEPKLCAFLRSLEEKEARAAAERERRQQEHQQRVDEERRKDEMARAAQQEAEEAKRQERMATEKRARDEATARARAEQEEADRIQEAADRKLRAQCGADYGSPRVGMTLRRAQQCVGTFTMFGQVQGPAGVVAQYRAGSLYLNVKDGVIVHWARF